MGPENTPQEAFTTPTSTLALNNNNNNKYDTMKCHTRISSGLNKSRKLPPQRALEMVPLQNKIQQEQIINNLRKEVKNNGTVAVENVTIKNHNDDATMSDDTDSFKVKTSKQSSNVAKKQKTEGSTKKNTTTSKIKKIKKVNTQTSTQKNNSKQQIDMIPVPKPPQKDAICKHNVTILECKIMEQRDVNYYINPGQYLEGMKCNGCNTTTKILHSKNQAIYICNKDLKIYNIDMEDDVEAKIGRCYTLFCFACWEAKQPSGRPKRQRK